ncbi:MAG: hypothetical protein AAFQ58_04730 [Pseudomonadota bacterium]
MMKDTALSLTTLDASHGQVTVDPGVGNIRALHLHDGGRTLTPLHSAPWINEAVPQDLSPVERNLSGDFFCAPFGTGDVEKTPAHGWTANSPWTAIKGGTGMTFKLRRKVMGAAITKHMTFAPEAPLLMQQHMIDGGTGGLTVAHHPMVHFATTATLSTSPKRVALTPDTPLEPDRNALACGHQTSDLTALPGQNGQPVDLTRLPIANRHEDFVTLVENHSTLGWTAILRDSEDDIVFFLKDASVLPITMLWHSNGGRDYAPWNGRHRNVIGVEDGCAAGVTGHRAALSPNPVSKLGSPTVLPLKPGHRHRIAHVTGAIVRPKGWQRVADIMVAGGMLTLTGDTGTTRTLPFPTDFFEQET